MADQDRCPECGHKSEPEKLRDPVGTQDVLPDEVLDRAVRQVPQDEYGPTAEDRNVVEAAAPVLVEHGVATERARIRGILNATKLDSDRLSADDADVFEDGLNIVLAALDKEVDR